MEEEVVVTVASPIHLHTTTFHTLITPTASGQDAAPDPQDAAPVPNRDTASGQDELESQTAASPSAQTSRGPPSKRRRMDNGEEDADQGVEMPCDPHSFSAVECRAMPRAMPRGAFFQNVIMPWID